jgi:serine/threonine protein kinase
MLHVLKYISFKSICFSIIASSFAYFSKIISLPEQRDFTSGKGYAAPEIVNPGADSIRADIYSFGVILLVLLTGQKAFDRYVFVSYYTLVLKIAL